MTFHLILTILAEEWRNWLFYFSLPTMTTYLPLKVKNHWKDFVEIMVLLFSSKINKADLDHGLINSIQNMIVFYHFMTDYYHNSIKYYHFVINMAVLVDRKLKKWIINYQTIYGKVHMTMNVHNLNHMVHFIRLYGPLKSFTCFHFEDMMGFIKRRVHSTKGFMKTYASTSSLQESIFEVKAELLDSCPEFKV